SCPGSGAGAGHALAPVPGSANRPPPAGAADPHAQARDLLSGRDVSVPAAFTPTRLQHLTQAQDTRLVQAAKAAQDGQVIQFLTFLDAAAPGYMTDAGWSSTAA